MNENLEPSPACIALTKQFESCRLTAYQDPNGIWTIGWGHTLGVKEGDTCTQDEADAWLTAELSSAGALVRHCVAVTLTQGQFDALADFVYNLGITRLRTSTLLRLVNMGMWAEAANEFGKWVFADGRPLTGLVRRRAAERALFEA
jgi:lysozyme